MPCELGKVPLRTELREYNVVYIATIYMLRITTGLPIPTDGVYGVPMFPSNIYIISPRKLSIDPLSLVRVRFFLLGHLAGTGWVTRGTEKGYASAES